MKKLFTSLLFYIAIFLPACSTQQPQKASPYRELIELKESVKIIRTLIAEHKLAPILEEHSPEQLDLLLNNFSPANMAFETEVLSTTVPLVVVYYYKPDDQETDFLHQLDTVACTYLDQVKCVAIDADALFTLAEDAEIEEFPTTVLVSKREILEKIAGPLSLEQLHNKLQKYRKTANPEMSGL